MHSLTFLIASQWTYTYTYITIVPIAMSGKVQCFIRQRHLLLNDRTIESTNSPRTYQFYS